MTRKQYTTVQITRCIYTPNLGFLYQMIGDMLRTCFFLELTPEVKATVIRKNSMRHSAPQGVSHTKYGIPTSNNIGDMFRTRFGRTHGRTHAWTVKNYAPNFGDIKHWFTLFRNIFFAPLFPGVPCSPEPLKLGMSRNENVT